MIKISPERGAVRHVVTAITALAAPLCVYGELNPIMTSVFYVLKRQLLTHIHVSHNVRYLRT